MPNTIVFNENNTFTVTLADSFTIEDARLDDITWNSENPGPKVFSAKASYEHLVALRDAIQDLPENFDEGLLNTVKEKITALENTPATAIITDTSITITDPTYDFSKNGSDFFNTSDNRKSISADGNTVILDRNNVTHLDMLDSYARTKNNYMRFDKGEETLLSLKPLPIDQIPIDSLSTLDQITAKFTALGKNATPDDIKQLKAQTLEIVKNMPNNQENKSNILTFLNNPDAPVNHHENFWKSWGATGTHVVITNYADTMNARDKKTPDTTEINTQINKLKN